MKKIVSTSMSSDLIQIQVTFSSSDSEFPNVTETCLIDLPVSLISPQVSLQIASLLASDPTKPRTDESKG